MRFYRVAWLDGQPQIDHGELMHTGWVLSRRFNKRYPKCKWETTIKAAVEIELRTLAGAGSAIWGANPPISVWFMVERICRLNRLYARLKRKKLV